MKIDKNFLDEIFKEASEKKYKKYSDRKLLRLSKMLRIALFPTRFIFILGLVYLTFVWTFFKIYGIITKQDVMNKFSDMVKVYVNYIMPRFY